MMSTGLVVLLLAGWGISSTAIQAASAGPAGWEADRRLTFDPGASQLSFNFAWSIAADDTGRVYIVWYDTRDGRPQIYYKRSNDGGANWGSDIRLSRNPGTNEHPAIAVSGSNVYVVWHNVRGGDFRIVFRGSRDGGATWGPETPLSSSGKAAHSSIAATGARVHVVWGDVREGHAEIYTRRSADAGAAWENEIRVSDSPYESWVPTVAVSGNNVFVGWVDYRDANEEEYVRRSTDGGVTWQQITRLTHDGADSWAPSMAAAGNNVHFVWFDRRDAGVTDTEVEKSVDETMRLIGLPVEPAPPRNPSVYYLPHFNARVQDKMRKIQARAPAWVQSGGDPKTLEGRLKEFERLMRLWATGWEIYYKRSSDGGATWGPDVRLTNAPAESARPSVAVSGVNVHVVWYDGRDGDAEVYYKRSSDGGMNWGPDIRLMYARGDSVHPTIAVSSKAVHVVWSDRRDGNWEIYYKRYQVADHAR